MIQEKRFREMARNAAAKAHRADTMALRARYVRLAATFNRAAEACAIKPSGDLAQPSDAVRAARMVATPADTRRESRVLQAEAETAQRRLLATMRASAQLQQRYRELEFETELVLLARGIA